MLSVDSLLFLRGTVAHALYSLKNAVKFVSPLTMRFRLFSFNKEYFWLWCFLRSLLAFLQKQF